MARLVTGIGPIAPTVAGALKTFDAGFATDPNALTSGRFGPQGFPWLFDNYPSARNDPGSVQTEMMGKDGSWVPVTQVPQELGDQTVINGELQFYCTNELLAQHGIAPLNRIVNGVLEMHAIQTPDSMKDICMASADTFGDFKLIAIDEANREIRVEGNRYSRKRPSDNGKYERGNYIGFDRFNRDELNSDAETLDQGMKRRKYDYGIVRLQVTNHRDQDRTVKYDRVIDERSTDPEYVSDASSQEKTYHRIRIRSGELTSEDWARLTDPGGAVMKLYKRQPWIAQMETTSGTFSQQYGIFDMKAKLHDHSEQFFAWWFWGQYLNMFKAKSDDPVAFIKFEDEWDNATELDGIESPGGTTGLRRYHNIHAANVGGMQNYAALNGIDQEMAANSPNLRDEPNPADNAEWDRDDQAGHIIGIQSGDPGHVRYDEWFRLRVMWVPPNHPLNPRPVGVVRWYIAQGDSDPLRYLCGVITPPWWDENPGAPKRIFLNNAVGGDFVSDNRYVFDKNGGSSDNSDTITNYVSLMEAYQFPNYVAGGSGYPDSSKQFSRGLLPTPDDLTGNSGTGQVTDSGEPGPGPGGNTGPATGVVDIQISSGTDDAEESASGAVTLGSSDLELTEDSTEQRVGMRFPGVDIPRGATITAAYLQFTADESHSLPADLLVRAQAADSAPGFTANAQDISSRPLTSAGATWQPPAWTEGDAGAAQRTTDLSAVVKEVVDRSGWASGNALVFVITGTGKRVAESFEGGAGVRVRIEWTASTTTGGGDTGGGTGGGTNQPVDDTFDGSVRAHLQLEELQDARAGESAPLRTVITANPYGYSGTSTYTTTIPGAVIEPDGVGGMQIRFTVDFIGFAADGVTLSFEQSGPKGSGRVIGTPATQAA